MEKSNMVATKRKPNWDHLKNVAHLAGPDAELRITLTNASADAEGPPDETVVVLKCRAGFIRSGNHLFVVPDFHGGGRPGRLEPNVWEILPTDEEGMLEGVCLTETDPHGQKPDVPEEIVAALEDAGFHWERWAAPD